METLENIKADAIVILSDMQRIGEKGPTRENAKEMQDRMKDLQAIVERLDNVSDNS